jgi:hypothetical protein
MTSTTLSDRDVQLLDGLERGKHTFRPADVEAPQTFAGLVEQLLRLRERGLIGLPDNHISRSQRGLFLMVGPCDLTPAGREALQRDRRLGPRIAPSRSQS